MENLAASIDGQVLFQNVDINLAKNDKVAVISKDSRATTAFYEILNGNLKPDAGTFAWGITTSQSYLPVDNSDFFTQDLSLVDWLRQWAKTEEEREEVYVRGFLGQDAFQWRGSPQKLQSALRRRESALYAQPYDDVARQYANAKRTYQPLGFEEHHRLQQLAEKLQLRDRKSVGRERV